MVAFFSPPNLVKYLIRADLISMGTFCLFIFRPVISCDHTSRSDTEFEDFRVFLIESHYTAQHTNTRIDARLFNPRLCSGSQYTVLCRSQLPGRAGCKGRKIAPPLLPGLPSEPCIGDAAPPFHILRPATLPSFTFPGPLIPLLGLGECPVRDAGCTSQASLTLIHPSPLLSLLFLFSFSRLPRLILQAPCKAVGTWVGLEDVRSCLGHVAHIGHGFVAHVIFGVLEAAAFKEDILCNTHPRIGRTVNASSGQ